MTTHQFRAGALGLFFLASGCADETVEVTGLAFAFALPGMEYGRITGGALSVLEDPTVTGTTEADGTFRLVGLRPGTEATFVLRADGYPASSTRTFTLPARGALERVTFQIPSDGIYGALADLLMHEPDPTRCQLVTTITRVGRSLFDEGAHGEEGATATLDPADGAARGPIYFGSDVIPDPSRTESSDDGGVLWLDVRPGRYVLRAHEAGVTFEEVHVDCRAGILVNASPPYGLQAL
ncbi:MAG: hypothetical protein KF729_22185 [Sandaracinaceae bacterium]|nr:hypothetical protein [Sandaracinaceae bacterium]